MDSERRAVRGTRREWLQLMAALGVGAMVERLFPPTLARAWPAQGGQQPVDRLAAFRAQFGAAPIQSQALSEKLTLLSGPGGSVVVLHGADGLVMVDTFVAPAWPNLKQALSTFGKLPLKTVINTHWHFDHTDNNAPLRAAGATLLAHENTKRRMSEAHHLAIIDLAIPPSPPDALPQRVFKEGYRLEANGEWLTLTHIPRAHTDSDVAVRFEKANVLHAGDAFFSGMYPYIDGSTGGSLDGMLAGVDTLLAMADDATKVVAGHGPLATKADLAKFRDMLSTAGNRVRALKSAGKTAEEAVAAKPLADFEPVWGKGLFNGDVFVQIAYAVI
jgi:cyclase